jgi:hypothetical protein
MIEGEGDSLGLGVVYVHEPSEDRHEADLRARFEEHEADHVCWRRRWVASEHEHKVQCG